MFQFAKFEKFKERRLAIELGYNFMIVDPWITNALPSPNPNALSPLKESFLLNSLASDEFILFDSIEHGGRMNNVENLN
jgi:hypothetical protein